VLPGHAAAAVAVGVTSSLTFANRSATPVHGAMRAFACALELSGVPPLGVECAMFGGSGSEAISAVARATTGGSGSGSGSGSEALVAGYTYSPHFCTRPFGEAMSHSRRGFVLALRVQRGRKSGGAQSGSAGRLSVQEAACATLSLSDFTTLSRNAAALLPASEDGGLPARLLLGGSTQVRSSWCCCC